MADNFNLKKYRAKHKTGKINEDLQGMEQGSQQAEGGVKHFAPKVIESSYYEPDSKIRIKYLSNSRNGGYIIPKGYRFNIVAEGGMSRTSRQTDTAVGDTYETLEEGTHESVKIKCRKVVVTEAVLQTLPQGNDDLSKAMRLKQLLLNKFLTVNIEEGLTNLPNVQDLLEQIDRASNAVDKLADRHEDSDEKLYYSLQDIQTDLTGMWLCLADIVTAFEKRQNLKTNLKL